MLEKPDIPLTRIAACLQTAYGLTAVQITFLPLGADQNTAVFLRHLICPTCLDSKYDPTTAERPLSSLRSIPNFRQRIGNLV